MALDKYALGVFLKEARKQHSLARKARKALDTYGLTEDQRDAIIKAWEESAANCGRALMCAHGFLEVGAIA